MRWDTVNPVEPDKEGTYLATAIVATKATRVFTECIFIERQSYSLRGVMEQTRGIWPIEMTERRGL